jgi:hypothetical protein
MGREIRRVPPNWQHPRYERGERYGPDGDWEGEYKPLYDETFDSAIETWIKDGSAWVTQVREGKTPDPWYAKYAETDALRKTEEDWARANPWKAFAEWGSSPPDPETHRDAYTEEPTAWQVYQTVSEGTPISPVFTTEADMIAWMMRDHPYDDPRLRGELRWHALTEDGARRFIEAGSAPSLVFSSERGLVTGAEMFDDPKV